MQSALEYHGGIAKPKWHTWVAIRTPERRQRCIISILPTDRDLLVTAFTIDRREYGSIAKTVDTVLHTRNEVGAGYSLEIQACLVDREAHHAVFL